MFKRSMLLLLMLMVAVTPVLAQNSLDGDPLDPETDPAIDMFISSWQESRPFNTHGALTERMIMQPLRGNDPVWPERPGEVLTYINRVSRATIDALASTSPTTLDGEQEIMYITAGTGIVETATQREEIEKGYVLLVPEGLEFTIQNTGKDMLEMYLVSEPTPPGFRPNEEILIRNTRTMPNRDQGYLTVHWAHNGKNVFNVQDGLAELELVNILKADPMTIGQPHSHGESVEEIWTCVEGTNLVLLGKEIRWQTPGTAYKIPPTGFTPHSNVNTTEEPVIFLYVARFNDHDPRP